MDDKVKELLDWVMSRAGTAADAAAGTARAAGRRAGQMVDVARLNVQLFDLDGELDGVLRQLGQIMYATHRGQASDQEQVSRLLAQADDLSERIAGLKERIADLRLSRTCPACGAPCGREDKFCRDCGATL